MKSPAEASTVCIAMQAMHEICWLNALSLHTVDLENFRSLAADRLDLTIRRAAILCFDGPPEFLDDKSRLLSYAAMGMLSRWNIDYYASKEIVDTVMGWLRTGSPKEIT